MLPADTSTAGNPALAAPAPAPSPTPDPTTQYDEQFQASLNDARSSVQSSLRNALDEINRNGALGQQQVATLPSQYGTINDQATKRINDLGSHADQTQANAGVASYQPASSALAPILATMAAQQSTRQAGVPLISLGLQQEAGRQGATAQNAANQALSSIDQEQRNYYMQQAQQAQAAAKTAAQRNPSQILSDAFGSPADFNSYVTQNTPAAQAAQLAQYQQTQSQLQQLGGHGNMAAEAERNTNQNPGLSSTDVAETLGQGLGLPPGVASAVYAPEAAKQVTAQQKAVDQQAEFDPVKISGRTGISAGMVRSIQGASFYKAADAKTQQVLQNPVNPDGTPFTREQYQEGLLRDFGKYPSTVKILMAEYGPLFPTAAQAATIPTGG